MRLLATSIAAAALVFATGAATAIGTTAATVGQAAPAFTAKDAAGKTVSLADFKGKHVVLEWVNPGCPYVVKHYGSGNMQGTQREATAQGVVWLSINSTAADASDYRKPADMAGWMQQQKAAATTTLMDESGSIGRAYGARTTPHMYIIDPQGKLVYAGGIDDKPTTRQADIAGATNHVKVALAETLAGKPIGQPVTRPYGCAVKYSSM